MIGLLGLTPMAYTPRGGIDFPLTEVAMAGRGSPVTDIREILRRVQLGEPDRRIARDLGVGRNTVGRYRAWAREHGVLDGGPTLCVRMSETVPTPEITVEGETG